MNIVAQDLQGLLYLMTRSLSRCGLHIHSAKIATWNARAENNFYVTTAAGERIPDADLSLWADRLARALQAGEVVISDSGFRIPDSVDFGNGNRTWLYCPHVIYGVSEGTGAVLGGVLITPNW